MARPDFPHGALARQGHSLSIGPGEPSRAEPDYSSGVGVNTDTAGDGEVVAGDVAGGVRGEEGYGFGDVGGSADAAERERPARESIISWETPILR